MRKRVFSGITTPDSEQKNLLFYFCHARVGINLQDHIVSSSIYQWTESVSGLGKVKSEAHFRATSPNVTCKVIVPQWALSGLRSLLMDEGR